MYNLYSIYFHFFLFSYSCELQVFDEIKIRIGLSYVQPPTSAVNVTLLAFAAERRPCQHAINKHLLLAGRTAANPQQRCAAGE